ncbi:Bug family tripartite tricarboxylate transporter substrate binding protein [Pararoseomonas indoligenes]|uniref:Tripartite tricarboxylate transporter substrate binding protein n=1 Tax=Roseomonas indoligenes TaxID=2820811 RepID=A0A940S809_9PROT|nr:tripartite tricarboxylate transporter substrate binding protein [Pararoseomonas indoligenes]MBP0495460.1 tripartite tricarboxylate transporter substrate binding protein [Pararoseomonas indoligenes]
MVTITRRGLGAGMAALVLARGAQAAAYPDRPVTIISPFAAGGQSDPLGRAVALHLQRKLGQPFVLENRTGAGSTIGAQYVARAAADGHTLLFGTTSTFVIAPFVYGNAGYDPAASFAPVAVASEGPMVLTTHARSGYASVADVVAAAKRSPGRITYASAGSGSLPHLLGEVFARVTGTELTHVPYRGGAPAMNDLIGGQVDLFFEAVANVVPHVESGRAVALMSTGPARSPLLPTVPTAAELGHRDLTLTSWTGFAAPAGTPAPIVESLNQGINEALRLPEVVALMERIGISGIGGGAADMAGRIARESAIYKGIITAAKISAE